MMIIMINRFSSMVDRRKAFSLISSRDHCQRSSPSRISNTPRAGFRLSWMMLCSSDNRYHGTIIGTGITCNKMSCYMHDSACRWLIFDNFWYYFNVMLNIFEFSHVKEILESWLVYVNISFHESSSHVSWPRQ